MEPSNVESDGSTSLAEFTPETITPYARMLPTNCIPASRTPTSQAFARSGARFNGESELAFSAYCQRQPKRDFPPLHLRHRPH